MEDPERLMRLMQESVREDAKDASGFYPGEREVMNDHLRKYAMVSRFQCPHEASDTGRAAPSRSALGRAFFICIFPAYW